jgi:hypothetical protein
MKSPRGKLEEEVSRWPHVSVHGHRFGGKEFRFHRAELDTCTRAVSWTFLFRDPFATRFWLEVLPRSITGCPIPGGSLSA